MKHEIAESSPLRIDTVTDLLGELDSLLFENEKEAESRVSLYLPLGEDTRFCTSDTEQLRTDFRFGNLFHSELEQAIEWSRYHAHSPEEQSLAVFAENECFRALRIPHVIEEACYESTHWHLSPLLSLACNVDCYWALVLTTRAVKLFRGSKLGIRQISVPHMPTSLTSAKEFSNASLSRHLDAVRNGVEKSVASSDSPVLLVTGAEFAAEDFSDVFRDQAVEQRKAEGDWYRDPQSIHLRAGEILQEHFEKSRQDQLEKVCSIAFHKESTRELAEVLGNASDGQVNAIILPTDDIFWGSYDEQNNKVAELPRSSADGRDLYQLAAEKTLTYGGELFYASRSELPEEVKICAELRE